jgi:radical SAM protein with 4Fe4S-binding SPASM domain
MENAPLPPRRRGLPVAPLADPPRRRLPLASEARDIDRASRPTYAVWELTLRCDLACRHCGSRAGRARPEELTTPEALALVDQLATLGVFEVSLIGGEAYLRDDWVVIARAIRDAGMDVNMVTGGRGFTRERAEQARAAGIRNVSVSVDALEATHDALRGVRGSFRSAMAAFEAARSAGLAIAANTQIARPALREIEPLTELLAEQGLYAWQVAMTVPMGRAADEPELILEPYQVLEVMAMLSRVQPRLAARGVRVWPGNDIGYFGPYERLLRPHLPGGHMAPCGAGRATLGIEADGTVKGCPSLPTKDYGGGNVRDALLVDIWERAEPLRFTRERTVDDLWGGCRGCYYAEDCLGGCSWTAHTLFGRTGNNPFCHHRALELLREGKRERLEPLTSAEGKPFDHGTFACVVEDWPADELPRARELAATGEGWLARPAT